jgi:hypothetical protein
VKLCPRKLTMDRWIGLFWMLIEWVILDAPW